MWFYLGLGVFFIGLGLGVHVYKWYFLISGYNTMSKEKKARVDTAGLGRLIGIYSYVNGGVLLLMGLLHGVGLKPSLIPIIVVFGLSTLYLMVKSQKYDGNLFDEGGRLRPGAKKKLAIPAGIMVVSFILVGVLLFFSSRPTEVNLIDEGLQIHGMYGDVYAWDSIESIQLMEELPTIELRTNGSAVGSHLKGHFRTTELGSVKLFVDAEKSPFIYLEAEGRVIIFNLEAEEETREVFKEIQKRISG